MAIETTERDLELLRGARARIADPAHWTQGQWARDAEGKPIDPASPAAVCFCFEGAIIAAAGGTHDANGNRVLVGPMMIVWKSLLGGGESWAGPLFAFNDTHTHAEILELLDKAIDSKPADA